MYLNMKNFKKEKKKKILISQFVSQKVRKIYFK